MKRDWDCIRAILAGLEALENTHSSLRAEAVPSFDAEMVSYNMHLMIQARLIDGVCSEALSGPLDCSAMAMTWEGHELFDKIRSDTIWNQIKKMAREKGIGLSFEAVKILGTAVLKHYIGG
jgi:uncharacterized protein DUF2513